MLFREQEWNSRCLKLGRWWNTITFDVAMLTSELSCQRMFTASNFDPPGFVAVHLFSVDRIVRWSTPDLCYTFFCGRNFLRDISLTTL